MKPEHVSTAAAILKSLIEIDALRKKINTERVNQAGFRLAVSSDWVPIPDNHLHAVKAIVLRDLDEREAGHRRRAAQIGLVL